PASDGLVERLLQTERILVLHFDLAARLLPMLVVASLRLALTLPDLVGADADAFFPVDVGHLILLVADIKPAHRLFVSHGQAGTLTAISARRGRWSEARFARASLRTSACTVSTPWPTKMWSSRSNGKREGKVARGRP